MDDLYYQNELLRFENEDLRSRIMLLNNKLKKYTNPTRNKKFYQNHREEIIDRVKQYRAENKNKIKPVSKEQRKLYNKRYYQKKKLEKNKNL